MKTPKTAAILKSLLGTEVEAEYRFHPTRKWRFDYALPFHLIAIEVEGGVWTQGRHTRPAGFLRDMDKYNAATLLGWRVFRVTPQQLLEREFLSLVEQAIARSAGVPNGKRDGVQQPGAAVEGGSVEDGDGL